jgi:hypothetical protein
MNTQLELEGVPRRRAVILRPGEELTPWVSDAEPPRSGYWETFDAWDTYQRFWFDAEGHRSSRQFVWRGLQKPPAEGYPPDYGMTEGASRRVILRRVLC